MTVNLPCTNRVIFVRGRFMKVGDAFYSPQKILNVPLFFQLTSVNTHRENTRVFIFPKPAAAKVDKQQTRHRRLYYPPLFVQRDFLLRSETNVWSLLLSSSREIHSYQQHSLTLLLDVNHEIVSLLSPCLCVDRSQISFSSNVSSWETPKANVK